jgi:hypothetical protein
MKNGRNRRSKLRPFGDFVAWGENLFPLTPTTKFKKFGKRGTFKLALNSSFTLKKGAMPLRLTLNPRLMD